MKVPENWQHPEEKPPEPEKDTSAEDERKPPPASIMGMAMAMGIEKQE